MSIVHIRHAAYHYRSIRSIIFEMLESTEAPNIEVGTHVLIKPNLLSPASPEKAVTTHPLIVRATAEYALEKGAQVQISDSPAVGSFPKLLKIGGYAEALTGMEVMLKPFEATVPVDVGAPFGTIEIAEDAMNADVVLNLAKLKTHTQMMLTLGVKNLFGCIVGFKKPEWHMRAGVDRKLFGRLIVSICEAVSPGYTIVDGILGMEGQGPGKSGTPREMGMLIGGEDVHAVDHAICLQVGLEPATLETQCSATEMGFYDGGVRIDGTQNILNDFELPELGTLITGPKYLGRLMRRFVIQKPVADNQACQQCGECWKYCPANAIDHVDQGITFNTERCIRCYCCLEVCPHAAIRAEKPVAGRVIEYLKEKRALFSVRPEIG